MGAQPALQRSGDADIVIGILSYNDAETIGPVIGAAQHGLSRFFPDVRAVIVNADGGSRDGTAAAATDPDSFLQISYPVYPVHRIADNYPGVPGKGNALRAVFEVAEKMGARACAVVQSDVRSMTPEWTEALLRPVFDSEADYVAP